MRKIKVVSEMLDNIYRQSDDHSDTIKHAKSTHKQQVPLNQPINTLEDFHSKPYKQNLHHNRSQTFIDPPKSIESNKDLDFIIIQDKEPYYRFSPGKVLKNELTLKKQPILKRKIFNPRNSPRIKKMDSTRTVELPPAVVESGQFELEKSSQPKIIFPKFTKANTSYLQENSIPSPIVKIVQT